MGNVKKLLLKVWDPIDTFIVRLQFKYSIRRFFERLQMCWDFWKTSRKVYDFDWTGLLEVEKHQLKRMIKSISKYQHHVNWEHDVKWMQICVNLIDIILDNDWWEIKGFELVFNEDDTLESKGKAEYVFKNYINPRNSKRFLSYKKTIDGSALVSLREVKALNLLCNIKKNYLWNWWD